MLLIARKCGRLIELIAQRLQRVGKTETADEKEKDEASRGLATRLYRRHFSPVTFNHA